MCMCILVGKEEYLQQCLCVYHFFPVVILIQFYPQNKRKIKYFDLLQYNYGNELRKMDEGNFCPVKSPWKKTTLDIVVFTTFLTNFFAKNCLTSSLVSFFIHITSEKLYASYHVYVNSKSHIIASFFAHKHDQSHHGSFLCGKIKGN